MGGVSALRQALGGSSVDPVPVGLALDAARGGRLVPQARSGYPPAAAFADPVGTLAQALERALDLLAVLVQQVHQQVAGLPVGEGLREVGLLGNPRDHTAGDVVERSVQARLLAALRGQELEQPPVSFQPLLWSASRLL